MDVQNENVLIEQKAREEIEALFKQAIVDRVEERVENVAKKTLDEMKKELAPIASNTFGLKNLKKEISDIRRIIEDEVQAAVLELTNRLERQEKSLQSIADAAGGIARTACQDEVSKRFDRLDAMALRQWWLLGFVALLSLAAVAVPFFL